MEKAKQFGQKSKIGHSPNCRLFIDLPREIMTTKEGKDAINSRIDDIRNMRNIILKGATYRQDLDCNYGIVVTCFSPTHIRVTLFIMEVRSKVRSADTLIGQYNIHRGKQSHRNFVRNVLQYIEMVKDAIRRFDREIRCLGDRIVNSFNNDTIEGKADYLRSAFRAHTTLSNPYNYSLSYTYNKENEQFVSNMFSQLTTVAGKLKESIKNGE